MRRKRYTCLEIMEIIKSFGYELIDHEYINSKKKLTIKDGDGYFYYICYDNLRRSQIPERFDIVNPYTIQNIKLWLVLNNKPYKLISDKYEGNRKFLLWKCLRKDCGEIFELTWHSMSRNGCPYCAGQKVGLSNCLATKNPDLAAEWHPTLNGDLTPNNVTSKSGKYAWWKCKECCHVWQAIISSRNKGVGCPECNKSKGEKKISEILKKKCVNYIPQKEFKGLIGVSGGLLSYDFYLPDYNLLIEYQGEQHEKYIKGLHKSRKDFEKQQEHDRRKKEYAKINNYNLLEIWYWDFGRIEEILDEIC